jgi:hypothetical protein
VIGGVESIKTKQKEKLDWLILFTREVQEILITEECGSVMMKLTKVNQFQKQILFPMVGEKEDFVNKDFSGKSCLAVALVYARVAKVA